MKNTTLVVFYDGQRFERRSSLFDVRNITRRVLFEAELDFEEDPYEFSIPFILYETKEKPVGNKRVFLPVACFLSNYLFRFSGPALPIYFN